MTLTIPDSSAHLLGIAGLFLGSDTALSVQPLGAGLINSTFQVDQAKGSYVLQRINPHVFPAPELIMRNLAQLQALADARPEFGVRLPTLIMASDGRPFVRDLDGSLWRLMQRVHPSRVLDRVQTPKQASEIGRMLGRFHRLAAELDPQCLHITLPGFHDTPSYMAALDAALTETGAADAAPAAVLDFISERRALATVMEVALLEAKTRLRVIHGDPKIDNLLFAHDADRALCLIDLDTVQPGLIHHDIADCLRSCCNRRGESAAADAPVQFDLAVCAAILGAYAEQIGDLLSSAELDLMLDAARLIPFELGIRFLTDHLQGDRYFRVRQRGDNLLKARVQFDLVADIERKAEDITKIIARSFLRGDLR